MTTNINRQPAGVPTGGQFATSTRQESVVTLADARGAARQALGETETAYRAARERAHQVEVAQWIADADLPPGATVDLVTWPEEPNGDGTYDIDLGTVYDADGEEFDDLSGENGAIPAGHSDSDSTDLDVFLADGRDDRISVDKVRAWVAEQGLSGQPGDPYDDLHETSDRWATSLDAEQARRFLVASGVSEHEIDQALAADELVDLTVDVASTYASDAVNGNDSCTDLEARLNSLIRTDPAPER
ncbi:hypothetical protein [Nocardioides pakistanensis]